MYLIFCLSEKEHVVLEAVDNNTICIPERLEVKFHMHTKMRELCYRHFRNAGLKLTSTSFLVLYRRISHGDRRTKLMGTGP